ncbi:MAG: 50S ribosomal protein L29 [Bryobacterales bacterium]|jgi:large subunit ribosomal protein L29|nr:50S ribosomal protein L29 [Bryobacterales bacterium]
MKAEKIRELESAELEKQMKDMQESMFRIRFQMSLGQADGLKKYRETKKDRARILTVLRERAK